MIKSHQMRTVVLAVFLLLGLIYVSYAQTPTATQGAPSISVNNQQVVNGTVTIQSVVAAQDGWVVIHRSANGTFGDAIGHTFVRAGTTSDVVVPIEVSQATETLFAMLHVDAGQLGVYEFPGVDQPAEVNGAVVAQPFTVTNFSQLNVTPGAGTGTPTQATPTAGAGTRAATATPVQVLPKTGREMQATPTVTAGTATATPVQVLPKTGREMQATPTVTAGTATAAAGTPTAAAGTPTAAAGTPTAATGTPTAAAGTPTAGAGTPTATPGQVLPKTGQDGKTPWGLILLVPGIVLLLVGGSMALVTRRR